MTCFSCGAGLTFNELGLNKKYNSRASALCMGCLAQKLGVPQARLEEKIEEFIRSGCKLFAEKAPPGGAR